MACPLRIQYEGALYGLTLRGNELEVIVRDDDDRHRYWPIPPIVNSIMRCDPIPLIL